MAQSGLNKVIAEKSSPDSRKLLGILSAVFIFIAGLMILQDFLEAQRVGRSFYFSESFLFKAIWFLFIPILMLLYKQLKQRRLTGPYSTFLYILVPILVHFLILPFVFLFFSILFYGGRYDLYKILTYTLANDLYVLILVYSTFVLGFKYFSKAASAKISAEGPASPETLVINNGKDNSIIKIIEIVQIVAATPYVSIQLKDKKFLHTATLRSIHKLLDQTIFIRVHKSAIVNIHQILSFKSRLNGDYDLQLKNGEEVRLSRTYAAEFKKRFEPAKRVSL